jgi:hypothetical protein
MDTTQPVPVDTAPPAGVQPPGSGHPARAVKSALEVDPKTGKYLVTENEKRGMLAEILRNANAPGPLLGPKN